MNTCNQSLQQKIRLYRSLFSGLDHVYGTYDPKTGKVRIIKRRVTDNVIYNHLKGIQPCGIYLLRGEKTKAAVADFDSLDTSHPLAFIKQAQHYQLPCYVERSKSKGFHVWMFFDEKGVLVSKTRTVMHHILDEIECPATEVFPKQNKLIPQKPYGNFINAPLFGALVPKGKTVFVDPHHSFQPYPDQWTVLKSIQRISERQLDDVIEINQLTINEKRENPSITKGKNNPGNNHVLLPCARTILEQGVSEFQRVTCFRLAVHLKQIGFPQDIAVSILNAWSIKNKPIRGKQIITEDEIIEQTKSAYNNPYQSYGCEEPAIKPFCDPNCPVYKKIHSASTQNIRNERKQ